MYSWKERLSNWGKLDATRKCPELCYLHSFASREKKEKHLNHLLNRVSSPRHSCETASNAILKR